MDLELLEKICRQYNLGELKYTPAQLKGGFLHKMYSLVTTKGHYAIKLLNPFIMQRESAMENYSAAEKLEMLLQKNNIPIIPALILRDRKMQQIEGQYFYLYEWYGGKALKTREIKEIHCHKIGRLLAEIHKLGRREEPYRRNEIHIDWKYYVGQFYTRNRDIYHLLDENISLFYEIQNNGNIAVKKLPPIVSVCHNDMDPKNVLWKGTEMRIIDLECLGWSSPFIELYELALCWSGYERCNIDYHLFRCLLCSYAEAGGELPTDWETIYWSNYSRLEWLEYNLKRALGIECSEDEIAIGISEAKNTIRLTAYYHAEHQNIIKNCEMILESPAVEELPGPNP